MFNIGNWHFNYLVHVYNNPRINERAIEVPVAVKMLKELPKALEVGAVTPHYLYKTHEVIDLYEEFPGVINADVLTYQPLDAPYDLVFSISTLEHLQGEAEFHLAIERMKSWLSPEGFLYFTVPFGQEEWMDKVMAEGLDSFEVLRFDKVKPEIHDWGMVPLDTPLRLYNGDSRWGNSVFLCFYPYCPFLPRVTEPLDSHPLQPASIPIP